MKQTTKGAEMSLIFGKNSQVSFKDDAEKYSFIGYLTKSVVFIQWENNDQQGAWGKEGRMAFTTADGLCLSNLCATKPS